MDSHASATLMELGIKKIQKNGYQLFRSLLNDIKKEGKVNNDLVRTVDSNRKVYHYNN